MTASYELHRGDALQLLCTLPDTHYHCAVTSPPYFGLRDYGVNGQMGLEDSLEEFLDDMVRVFRQVRRVLRPDGLLWVNMGDSYAQSGKSSYADKTNTLRTKERRYTTEAFARVDGWQRSAGSASATGLAPKQLVMQSVMLALALQADGWWLRSHLIWSKPNPMPCGAQDRPALDFEHIFMLSRAPRYYYDQHGWRKSSGAKAKTTWRIPIYTQKSHSHHASFPPELPRRAICLSTSAHGCCGACGAPWVREVEPVAGYAANLGESWNDHVDDLSRGQRGAPQVSGNPWVTTGWRAACQCESQVVPCRVLDPFSGSGTTGDVALRLGRDYTGIELNPDYLEASRERLEAARVGIGVQEKRAGQMSLFDGVAAQ